VRVVCVCVVCFVCVRVCVYMCVVVTVKKVPEFQVRLPRFVSVINKNI